MVKGLIHMMKQQLKDIKDSLSSAKELGSRQEGAQARTEELFVPLVIQEEVKRNFAHGFINPAARLT
eukprot:6481867-Prorocentrum_lima.AAC.1